MILSSFKSNTGSTVPLLQTKPWALCCFSIRVPGLPGRPRYVALCPDTVPGARALQHAASIGFVSRCLHLFCSQACAWLPSISSLVTRHTARAGFSPLYTGFGTYACDFSRITASIPASVRSGSLHTGRSVASALLQSKAVLWCKETAGVVAEDYIHFGRTRIVAGSPIQGSHAFAQAACNRNIGKKDLRQGSVDRYELRSPSLCCKWRSAREHSVRECKT